MNVYVQPHLKTLAAAPLIFVAATVASARDLTADDFLKTCTSEVQVWRYETEAKENLVIVGARPDNYCAGFLAGIALVMDDRGDICLDAFSGTAFFISILSTYVREHGGDRPAHKVASQAFQRAFACSETD
jgi:hypothetical protein